MKNSISELNLKYAILIKPTYCNTIVDAIMSSGDYVSSQRNLTQNAGIKVLPNPASNYIQVSSNVAIKTIRIIDMMGREVISLNNINQRSISIQVSDLTKGMYFVITNGVSQKLMIK